MADVAAMDVVIGAKIQGVEQGLNKVQQDLAKTALAANKLDSSFDKASKGVQKSTTNFTNLSRVIQDLPFGFIGIQNNITQLLPAAGALGLVISAVVSAITFAQVGFSSWTRGLKDNTEKVKKAKDEAKEFAEALQSAAAGALSTGLQLQQYANIARDANKSLEERNFALREANKILGEHGEKLTLVNINTAAATEEINKFTNALINQALAAKYADKASDLIIKQRELFKDNTKALNDLSAAQQNFRNFKITGNESFDELGKKVIDLNNKLFNLNTTNEDIKKGLRDVFRDLALTTEESTKLFGELGIKEKETGRNLETVSKILTDLNNKFDFLNQKSFNERLDVSKDKINALEDAIQRLIKVKAPQGLLDDLFESINDIQLPITLREFGEFIKKNFQEKIQIPVEIQIGTDPQASKFQELKATVEKLLKSIHAKIPVTFDALNEKELTDLQSRIQGVFDKLNKTSQDLITSFQENLSSAVGQGIGDALSGEGFGSLFSGIFRVVGEAMKQLGETLIAASIGLQAIKKAFATLNPVIALGAGIALVALGTVIENKISKIPKFADGGIATGPTLGIFGEAGTEAIIPLDRLKEFVKTGTGTVEVTGAFELRGDRLRALVKRADNKAGRTI